MSKGNLLFISPTGTYDNGAEISVFYLMKYLVGVGYNVFNIAPQAFHHKQTEYYDHYQKNGIETHFIPALKWWWEEAPGGRPGTEDERAASYRENIGEIIRYIKEKNIDLVLTNTVNMFQGALAAAASEVPHFWLVHEFPSGEFEYYREKIDFIDEYSDAIFSVTGELQDELKELFLDRDIKAFAPYTEINVEKQKKGLKKRIVSVGRLTERKNQLELIKAYELLNLPDIELVLIGAWDNHYKDKCDQYIKEHRIKNITFKGNLENPWAEITDLDICVFPSALETFGLVYVEALLNGIPVILSDNPGHLSAYEIFQFGNLYQSGNKEELADKINDILGHFEVEKRKAVEAIPSVKDKYQVSAVYYEIINAIEKKPITSLKAVRHVIPLYSTNESKSRLTRLESKGRKLYNKLRNKLNH